jgi:gamma-glutamyltranspeptidase/glutathione hydrolase
MGWRQFAACILGSLVAACGSETPALGVIGGGSPSRGAVTADEPAAAIVARDTLSAGGNAADAAVAAYFALSVTFPASAGLGAGGICVAFDGKAGDVKALDFLAHSPAEPAQSARSVAVPSGVRGMAALHARFGRLRFEQLVLPAERLARFGHRVSRALASQIAAHGDRLREDTAGRRLFFRADGAPLGEGDLMVQPDLAAVLAAIRTRGAGELYVGEPARRYLGGIRQLGGSLSTEDLRDYKPVWVDTTKRTLGNNEVHFSNVGQGIAAARSWDALSERDSYAALDDGADAAKAAAAAQALAKSHPATGNGAVDPRPNGYPESTEIRATATADEWREHSRGQGSTSIAIVDRDGGMVACGFTLAKPFGAARVIPGTGILLGEPVADAASSVAAMMVINKPTKTARMTAAAAQGPAAGGALALVALRAVAGNQPLSKAVGSARAVPAPARGALLVDDDGVRLIELLKSKGLAAEPGGTLGLVNIVNCPGGARRGTLVCDYRVDPRGNGLGAGAE